MIGESLTGVKVMRDGPEKVGRVSDGVGCGPSQPHIPPRREHGGRDTWDLIHAHVPWRNYLKCAFGVVGHHKPVLRLAVSRPLVPAQSHPECPTRCNLEP